MEWQTLKQRIGGMVADWTFGTQDWWNGRLYNRVMVELWQSRLLEQRIGEMVDRWNRGSMELWQVEPFDQRIGGIVEDWTLWNKVKTKWCLSEPLEQMVVETVTDWTIGTEYRQNGRVERLIGVTRKKCGMEPVGR